MNTNITLKLTRDEYELVRCAIAEYAINTAYAMRTMQVHRPSTMGIDAIQKGVIELAEGFGIQFKNRDNYKREVIAI